MRNRFAGECYRCGTWVPAGEGHFERFRQAWRVQHATCAIKNRGAPNAERAAHREAVLKARAAQTGKRAQRARRLIRQITVERSA